MKLYLYYERNFKSDYTWLDVGEDDVNVMIENDYRKRLASAEDPTHVQHRTPQQILEEDLNRPTYNSTQKSTRRSGSFEEYNADDNRLCSDTSLEDEILELRHADLYEAISALTPDQQELLTRIFWDGESPTEVARDLGVTTGAVTHRMERIYARLRKELARIRREEEE